MQILSTNLQTKKAKNFSVDGNLIFPFLLCQLSLKNKHTRKRRNDRRVNKVEHTKGLFRVHVAEFICSKN